MKLKIYCDNWIKDLLLILSPALPDNHTNRFPFITGPLLLLFYFQLLKIKPLNLIRRMIFLNLSPNLSRESILFSIYRFLSTETKDKRKSI